MQRYPYWFAKKNEGHGCRAGTPGHALAWRKNQGWTGKVSGRQIRPTEIVPDWRCLRLQDLTRLESEAWFGEMFLDDEVPARSTLRGVRHSQWIADGEAEERHVGSNFSAKCRIAASGRQGANFAGSLWVIDPLRLDH